jgi:hypothetical protein
VVYSYVCETTVVGGRDRIQYNTVQYCMNNNNNNSTHTLPQTWTAGILLWGGPVYRTCPLCPLLRTGQSMCVHDVQYSTRKAKSGNDVLCATWRVYQDHPVLYEVRRWKWTRCNTLRTLGTGHWALGTTKFSWQVWLDHNTHVDVDERAVHSFEGEGLERCRSGAGRGATKPSLAVAVAVVCFISFCNLFPRLRERARACMAA